MGPVCDHPGTATEETSGGPITGISKSLFWMVGVLAQADAPSSIKLAANLIAN
jgi:hypothetical protein